MGIVEDIRTLTTESLYSNIIQILTDDRSVQHNVLFCRIPVSSGFVPYCIVYVSVFKVIIIELPVERNSL